MDARLTQAIEYSLRETLGLAVHVLEFMPVGGGCINHGGRLRTTAGDWFLKWNLRQAYPGMFEAEARGLELLNAANGPYVPEVLATGACSDRSFIIMEWIEPGPRRGDFWEDFGTGLARLHRQSSDTFGLDHDNYIGSLPQPNDPAGNWVDFFINQRLEVQLRQAIDRGLMHSGHRKAFERLYRQIPGLFPEEPPALLHGDLWSGNYMTGPDGQAAIIDPAVYYGFREMDLAMSRLFGGFAPAFYESYREAWPLEPGYEDRFDVCNLYPLLVHVNLFGSGYVPQVEGILRRF